MDGYLLLVAALMVCWSSRILGDSKVKTVRAFTGEPVLLPCHVDDINDNTTVEWSKVGMRKYVVLLFRQGCETHGEKDPTFQYRSSLIMDELRHGNISLRISDVKLSDAGKYTCKTIHGKIQRTVSIELTVGAVSEPKLSVVPSTDAGVTLQCEVQCWFPRPDVTFLDDAGKEMSAHDEKIERRPEGCFSVTKRVTLQTAINSVTCKVNEGSLNRSKVEKFIMPDVCLTSCTHTIIIIIAVFTVFVFGLILCTALFYMKYRGRRSEENQADDKRSSSSGDPLNKDPNEEKLAESS